MWYGAGPKPANPAPLFCRTVRPGALVPVTPTAGSITRFHPGSEQQGGVAQQRDSLHLRPTWHVI